uniref:uncharacterized protein LOC122590005 n=1 Tax=Erigeron canadensis TaxID=72917 RepID=UPI001CB8D6F7|nr:uncharacterized protein LOC122590005 [Erigeron canadensis]
MSDSSASFSSSSDFEATEYESINRAVSQMNAVFNPEAISACLNVIFDEEENQSQAASSSSAPKLTRRRSTATEKFQFFHKAPTDYAGRPGFNIFQKCTSAIRQLAYSYKADALDEYLQIAQDTGYQCLDAFCKCVIQLYQHEYLRRPTEADIQRITAKHEEVHGFSGMLGSIDCMHWGGGTVQWHGNGNLFDDLLQDRAPKVEFEVNGQRFVKGYYLADGIYPECSCQVFQVPDGAESTKFKRYQEAARKDVEHAFGVGSSRSLADC